MEWWKKYLGTLKKEGRGGVSHKEELEHNFNEKVMDVAYHALEVSELLHQVLLNGQFYK